MLRSGGALMSQNATSSSESKVLTVAKGSTLAGEVLNEVNNTDDAQFPTVSSLPRDLVATLQHEFGGSLLITYWSVHH